MPAYGSAGQIGGANAARGFGGGGGGGGGGAGIHAAATRSGARRQGVGNENGRNYRGVTSTG